jgi:hypothetical protein
MSIVVELAYADRRGRAFLARLPSEELLVSLRRALAARAFDEEDRERASELRERLRCGLAHAIAHPGVDPDDVCQIYLEGGAPLFACTVVSTHRVSALLAGSSEVIEGFSLQVAGGGHLTPDALRAALEVWAERNFPDLALPRFVVWPWVDPDELQRELLDTSSIRQVDTLDVRECPAVARLPEAA